MEKKKELVLLVELYEGGGGGGGAYREATGTIGCLASDSSQIA